MSWQGHNHPNWWAFAAHRISGLLLALFLPFHFWALSRAIDGAANLDRFLRWTEQPLVRIAEGGLVALLAVHLTGGLRVLVLEFLAWHDWQKTAVALSAGLSLAVGLGFLLDVF
jgi:fumarate reductase subunit D